MLCSLNLATVLALARAPASQAQLVTWVQSIEEVNDASKMMVVNAIQAHEDAPGMTCSVLLHCPAWLSSHFSSKLAMPYVLASLCEPCIPFYAEFESAVIGKRRGSNDGDAKAVKKNKKTKTQKNADNFVNAQWSHRIPSMEVENKTWESFTATEDGKEV